jgi:hypothetical protein
MYCAARAGCSASEFRIRIAWNADVAPPNFPTCARTPQRLRTARRVLTARSATVTSTRAINHLNNTPKEKSVNAALRARVRYVVLALATVAVGLLVHFRGAALGPVTRDVLGDALWAMMIAWWVSALAPEMRVSSRATIALALCFAVEFSQLYRTPGLDELRRTRVGHLFLGSGFDPRDLAAYAVGVVSAFMLERACAAIRGRKAPERT